MAIFSKSNQTLMARAARVYALISYTPVILAFYLPFAPGFSPSPIVNNVSNLLGIVLGVLLLLALITLFFCGDPVKRKDGQKVDRRLFLILIPLAVPYLVIMNASLFKTVGGEFLHNISDNEKCHFTREVWKEIQGVKIKRNTLNIDRNDNASFGWNISKEEYNNLPETFFANIYASQSDFGLKVEGYDVIEGNVTLPEDQEYKYGCTTFWFLNPKKKNSDPFFYWY